MDPLDIVPFRPEHLDAAAELLAARQARLRASRPELPETFTRAAACRPILDGVLAKPGAHAVVALDEHGALTGYLAGWHRTEEIWGRAAWSPAEGHALADGVDPERVRDLYAAWAEHFVLRGIFRQYVHAAADDPELLAAWFRTGFGQMQAHSSVRISPDISPRETTFAIRPAVPEDAELLRPIFPIIPAALMRAPAYAISPPERFDTIHAEYAADLADPASRYWLAEENGIALGLVGFWEPDEPAPMLPDGATEMAVAMTLPEARGRGVMRALVETAWADAQSRGIEWAVTDWRTAALATHRSWIALGYRPLYYRLHRHIDERIAWARALAER
ncbi:MAG TPA: GNAT family N-acetyltransferase [Candidatus Limnocylindria bacterium]